MKEFIRNLIAFTSRERNGTIILAAILLVFLGARILVTYSPAKNKITLDKESMALLEDFNAQNRSVVGQLLNSGEDSPAENAINAQSGNESTRDLQQNVSAAEFPEETHLYYFDPNTASLEELLKLGLSSRASETLINYRNKGGRFREAGDLKKIYGLTEQAYERIKSYVRIAGPENKYSAIKPSEKMELNSADSAILTTLNGIGPVLASRIIKYRKLLGGYYSSAQLKEVYGISDSLYLSIEDYVYADTSQIKRIKINNVSEKELARHPYIGTYYAAGIIKYREFKGMFSGQDELLDNNLLPVGNEMKILHYIDFY